MEEIEYIHLGDILNQYSNEFIETYRRKLKEHGHYASGQLYNNLRTRIETHGTSINVYLEIADYFQYLNSGRKPTTNGGDGTLKVKISQWIRQKNIIPRPDKNGKLPTQEQLAYLITRKIHQEGYTGDGCFDETLKEINNKYIPLLKQALEQDFNDYYSIKILKDVNKILYKI